MPDVLNPNPSSPHAFANFDRLIRFLVTPFLESPSALKVDCEVLSRTQRIIIRVAFEGEDKGRVFGRGGRNIQAIRTVVQAIAQASGYTVHLDIFGGPPNDRSGERSSDRDRSDSRSDSNGDRPNRPPQRRSNRPPRSKR